MITEELKTLVADEAQHLRTFATKEERERLDFSNLHPANDKRCIYGQMCRGCFTDRATELVAQCAKPFSKFLTDYEPVPEEEGWVNKYSTRLYFSPIEYYIIQKGANNENLINYLKGETDQLDL